MADLKSRITIYGVAKASGVSLATVSRVINHKGNVKEETKRKVEAAIEKLGYKPNLVAQKLAASGKVMIGVVLPENITIPMVEFFRSALTVASRNNWRVVVFNTKPTRRASLEMLNEVITSNVNGAILFDNILNTEDIENLSAYDVPVVAINHSATGEQIASISIELPKVMEEMITNSMIYENKKMILCGAEVAGRFGLQCEQTFVDIMSKASHEFALKRVSSSYEEIYEEMMIYFKENRSALFFSRGSLMSIAICNAAKASGLRIPEDVEVVNLLCSQFDRISNPSISAFDSSWSDVGIKAMEMLGALLNGDLKEKHYLAKCEYVKRDTTLY